MPVRIAARILFLFASALVPVALNAQASVASGNQIALYAAPFFTRASNSTPDQGTFSFLGANQTSRLFTGVGLGLYDEFIYTRQLDAGIDLRGSVQKGANAHLNQFLIGARVAFHPASTSLRPYVEVLGGVGGSRAATNPVYQSKGEYGAFAGVDYRVAKYVDLRLIEVGYSSLQTISTASVTAAAVQPGNSQLLNFSAGIVFRLPQRIVP